MLIRMVLWYELIGNGLNEVRHIILVYITFAMYTLFVLCIALLIRK